MTDRAERAGIKYGPVVLQTMLRLPEFTRFYDILELSGWSQTPIYFALRYLVKHGMVAKTQPKFTLTERGRIAAAIVVGKRHSRVTRRSVKNCGYVGVEVSQ
jgi:hypothetical protein